MRKFGLLIGLLFLTLTSFGQVEITRADANLRTSPSIAKNAIAKIPKGTSLNVIDEVNVRTAKWAKVTYDGKDGYVNESLLRLPNSGTSHAIPSGKVKYYTNCEGNTVQSPTYYDSAPEGATAVCNDGTYSFSQNHRGTCSHHGGVKRWLD